MATSQRGERAFPPRRPRRGAPAIRGAPPRTGNRSDANTALSRCATVRARQAAGAGNCLSRLALTEVGNVTTEGQEGITTEGSRLATAMAAGPLRDSDRAGPRVPREAGRRLRRADLDGNQASLV